MRALSAMAVVLLLMTSLNGCSSSSSAQGSGVRDVSVQVKPTALTPLHDGLIAFTGARVDTNFPDVWVTDFSPETTRLLLVDARVLTGDGGFNGAGISWSGLALLTSQYGEDGGLLWLTDGTDAGTVPIGDLRDGVRHFQFTAAEIDGKFLFLSGVYYDPPFENRDDQLFRIDLSSIVR